MGNGASAGAVPYDSVEAAIADGKTQEEIDAYIAAKNAVEAKPVELTESETLQVKLMFQQVDADSNKMIDIAELTELFSTLGYLEDEVGPLAQQYMEKFDLVGNKELDLESFIKLYGSLKASEGHRIEKYHADIEAGEKEAARRLNNRVARAKDPHFDEKLEAQEKEKAHEKTLKRAATKKAQKNAQADASASEPKQSAGNNTEGTEAQKTETEAPKPAQTAEAASANESAEQKPATAEEGSDAA